MSGSCPTARSSLTTTPPPRSRSGAAARRRTSARGRPRWETRPAWSLASATTRRAAVSWPTSSRKALTCARYGQPNLRARSPCSSVPTAAARWRPSAAQVSGSVRTTSKRHGFVTPSCYTCRPIRFFSSLSRARRGPPSVSYATRAAWSRSTSHRRRDCAHTVRLVCPTSWRVWRPRSSSRRRARPRPSGFLWRTSRRYRC